MDIIYTYNIINLWYDINNNNYKLLYILKYIMVLEIFRND